MRKGTEKATGKTALIRVTGRTTIMVQYDDLSHPQAYGWHVKDRKDWDIDKGWSDTPNGILTEQNPRLIGTGCNWRAWVGGTDDDENRAYGWGATEPEAIEDLKQTLEEG